MNPRPGSSRTTAAAPAATRSGAGRARERYPRLLPHERDDGAGALRDSIVNGPRAEMATPLPLLGTDGSLEGPFGLSLFSPAVGHALQCLGTSLRTESILEDRQRELIILAIATELQSEYQLQAHLPMARAAGLGELEITAVLEGRSIADPLDDALVRFAQAAARVNAPTREFDVLAARLDQRAMFEVAAAAAYYRSLASMVSLSGVGGPEGTTRAAAKLPSLPADVPKGAELEAVTLQMEEREIACLLSALARCADTRDFEGLAGLYSEDGVLSTPGKSHSGRAGLADFVRADIGVVRALHHISAGHEIDVAPRALFATTRSTLFASHVREDSTACTTGGHYDVELVREDGRWRLHKGIINPAWVHEWTDLLPGAAIRLRGSMP